jgi:hypothetical protein
LIDVTYFHDFNEYTDFTECTVTISDIDITNLFQINDFNKTLTNSLEHVHKISWSYARDYEDVEE